MVRVLRWVSEQSGKKWIHPVEHPLDKGDTIKKVVGRTTKVVGVTQVHIPNPLHPLVPYHVLILEDEHGHRMPKKTIQEYKIGDSYKEEPDASENAFASVKIKYDFYEAVDEALELIGGISVTPETKILIKPNASIPGYAYLGVCTNPKLLDALIEVLLSKGAKPSNITIAEQSFFLPLEKAASKSGIPGIIAKHKVNWIDLSKTEFEEKRVREFTFQVSKAASSADLILNVPVIKTDVNTGISGAFENLTRFLSKENFMEFMKDQKKAILALSALPKALPPCITIGDASIGGQGAGPENGEPGFYNMVFASRNPIVHDTAVPSILGLRPLPYVELAAKLGMGEGNVANIHFVGNELRAIQRDVKWAIASRLGV